MADPLQARRETLESWQLLFQFYRDLEDELLWIQDKLQATVMKDWGTSLQSIQTIVKKHLVSLVQKSVTYTYACLTCASKLCWTVVLAFSSAFFTGLLSKHKEPLLIC